MFKPEHERARSMPRSVVCFSGMRDNYQTAWALAEAGLLEKLVTDLYADPANMPLARTLGKKFPKLLARHSPGISCRSVVTPMPVALRSLLMKTKLGSAGTQIQLDRALGRRARHEAWKTNS